MNEQERRNLFSDLIAQNQSQLYAYIFALVRNRQDAEDIFQSVCVILWQKFDSFQSGSSFFAWARQTAIFLVRNAFRRRKPVFISEELLNVLIDTKTDGRNDFADAYLAVLQHCKEKLADADRHLLELRYGEGLSSREIADQMGRPQQGVCNSLTRIRRSLFDCMDKEMAHEKRLAE
jgi:RNA polymerase sigma-70 factor, ECF subfamily